MKRFAIPAISLAALMASGVAFAQTTPDQQPTTDPNQQQMQQNQQQMQQNQDPATQTPDTQNKQDPAAQTPDTSAQQTTDGMNLNIDAKNAVLATSYIGSSVYSTTNENIGDINDLIFDDKGMIQAVVIGVGGFLGMGEKDVALPLDKINVTRDENNAIKLTVQATREELERAPAFDKTLFMVKAPGGDTTTTTPPAGDGTTTTPQQ